MPTGTQLAARFTDDVVAHVDALVEAGRFASRAEALRHAVEVYLDTERRRRIGDAIAEGYRQTPQDDDEIAGAEASARAMIAEEPW
jgi:Arc/MetJ-type ribon-helix-helix transcriptional regulator